MAMHLAARPVAKQQENLRYGNDTTTVKRAKQPEGNMIDANAEKHTSSNTIKKTESASLPRRDKPTRLSIERPSYANISTARKDAECPACECVDTAPKLQSNGWHKPPRERQSITPLNMDGFHLSKHNSVLIVKSKQNIIIIAWVTNGSTGLMLYLCALNAISVITLLWILLKSLYSGPSFRAIRPSLHDATPASCYHWSV
jgi:hypothetical protein